MKLPIINPPNLQLVERALTGNLNYSDDDLNISLITKLDDSDNTFEISLDAEKKSDRSHIRLETRIAIEQHAEGKGHQYPHIQIDNISSDDDLMKRGILHITLLVDSQEELDNCCNGFVYIMSEILKKIEIIFAVDKKLIEFFFYPVPLNNLQQYKKDLHTLIYRSFKENKLLYEKEGISLVEYKGKKSEDIDVTNYFRILGILLRMKLLDPVLVDPLLQLISEDGNIKSKCNIDIDNWKKELLLMDKTELKHLNRDSFIKKFAK